MAKSILAILKIYVIVILMNIKLKTVALIGRPNVGKSTLFNRLVEKRISIETPIPGTTRDQIFGEVTWGKETFNLIDVAGFEFGSKKEIDRNIQEGVNFAIDNSDLIVFVVDWTEPDNDVDRRVAQILRKAKKDIILAVNKADNIKRIEELERFNRLGGFPVVPVSAISGKNTGDLLDLITEHLETIETPAELPVPIADTVKLSIIGRPNVGKSTLLNTIIGEKRAIVSEEAGTTRDVINIRFMHEGRNIEISDTAGIRRPGKIGKDTIESFSLLSCFGNRRYRRISSSRCKYPW